MVFRLHISIISTLIHAREILDRLQGCLLGISSSGRNPCGGNKKFYARTLCEEGGGGEVLDQYLGIGKPLSV